MKLSRNGLSLLLSLLIIFTWTIIILVVAALSRSDESFGFRVSLLLVLTLFIGVGLGILIIMAGILKSKIKQSFLYSFGGVINLCLGITGVIMFFIHQLSGVFILLFALSFILGLFITVDILRFRKVIV